MADDATEVETAMVLPRVSLPTTSSGIALPQPLSPSEVTQLREQITALRGRHEAPSLAGTVLDGSIEAEYLLDRHAHASLDDDARYLRQYGDNPAAPLIYAALLRQLPWDAPLPPGPPSLRLNPPGAGVYVDDSALCTPARKALTTGHDQLARQLAVAGFLRSHRNDGSCAYLAGLASYQLGQKSAAWFEAASLSPGAGPGLQAAGAFWAARAHQKTGEIAQASAWAKRAGSFPHTLHGRLMLVLLDQHDPAQDRPAILAGLRGRDTATLGEAELEALAQSDAGQRLFASLQVGEHGWAQEAARQVWQESASQPAVRRAVLLLASSLHFDDMIDDARASLLPGDLPQRPLRPHGGFKLQPALIYAVARVESNFNPRALSGAGAQGLMQLRTETAQMVEDDPAAMALLLQNPERNLDLGQRYLVRLAAPDMVGDDLLLVLAGYNTGQGRVTGWKVDAQADPIMFLETIPVDETRHFVQRTLSQCWAYAARFDVAAPGLQQLAAGAWPKFSQTALVTAPSF